MNKINMRFLSGVLMLCFCGISAAHAAPTVKRLGSSTAKIGTNASVVTAPTPTKSSASSTPQRLGSVRGVGTTASVPTNRVSGSISSSGDANRLGFKVAPYVQTGNSISKMPKAQVPASQSSEPTVPSDWETRIEALENEMPNKQNNLRIKSGDEWIILEDDEISLNPNMTNRVSALEDLIQTKQNALTVGSGLSLIDDTLTLDIDLSQMEGISYTGEYGIAVDNENRKVKVDIANPVAGAIYVFKDGQWVALQIKDEWDPMN